MRNGKYGGGMSASGADELDLALLEPPQDAVEDGGGVGVGEVGHEQDGVGHLDHLREPGLHELARDRRRVDELDLDVLERHHVGGGGAGRERVIRDLRVGAGEAP